MLTPRPGARRPAAAGSSSASQASTPGPCRPTLLSIPAGVSCTRGAGLPAQGSADSDFTTTAPSVAEVDVGGRARRRGRRCPTRSSPGWAARPTRPWWSGRRSAVGRGRRRLTVTLAAPLARRRGTPAAAAPAARGGRSRPCRRRRPGRPATVVRQRHAVARRRRARMWAPSARGPRPRGRVDHEVDLAAVDAGRRRRLAASASPSLATTVADRRRRRPRRWSAVPDGGDDARSRARRSCRAACDARRPCRGRRATGTPCPTVGQRGRRPPVWLLAKARPKVRSMPITSPVERISGPSTGRRRGSG